MRKLLGRLAFCAGLGVLIVATGTPVARAATIYEITVTITDLTTSTTTTFVVPSGSAHDLSANPAVITVDPGYLGTTTTPSGATFTGLTATTKTTATGTEMDVQGAFTLSHGVPGSVSTDHYNVTIMTTRDTFTFPPAAFPAVLATSTSGSYTYTTAGNTQKTDSYYSPTNTANDTTDGHAGPAFIPGGIPVAGASNASGSSPTATTGISPYVIPYALTNVIFIDITGNTPNATTVLAQSVTTLNSVPEPASLVMFLTGMPLPLVVVGLLRRRRRAAG